MKKITTLILTLIFCANSFSQNKEERIHESLKDIENSKSGNFLDAFAGFYQFAFKTLSVNEKSLELNSTLFSLVNNYDEDITQTQSRKSIVFLRNFQINGKLNLNDNLNFNGYSAGFTYAVLNKRDKGFLNFNNTPIELHLNQLSALIAAVTASMTITEDAKYLAATGSNMNLAQLKALGYKLTKIGTAFASNKEVDASLLEMSIDYKTQLDAQILASPYFAALTNKAGNAVTKTDDVYAFIGELKEEYLKNLEKKPFLSLASEGISDKEGKLNQASIGTVFLVGNHFGELDVRAKYNYADTISPSMKRSVFNGKLGYNFKFMNKKNSKSFFEVKLYGEYNKIFDNVLPDEKEETVLANSDLRIRLSDDLWIPLTIKYDVENENFLGFLNVTYNFDGGKDKD